MSGYFDRRSGLFEHAFESAFSYSDYLVHRE